MIPRFFDVDLCAHPHLHVLCLDRTCYTGHDLVLVMANFLRDRWHQLKSEQKLAITALSVCCVFLMYGGWSQLNANVRQPFSVSRAEIQRSLALLTQGTQDDQKTINDLKLKDTDRDGVSDYDEIYVYHTSPYLADSDSDGIPDGQEIAKGTDPNCPQGKTCSAAQTAVGSSATSTLLGEAAAAAGTGLNASGTPIVADVQPTSTSSALDDFVNNPPLPGSMTASATRAYLADHGLVAQSDLAALPDGAVLQAYQLSYQEAIHIKAARGGGASGGGGVATSTISASSTPLPPEPAAPTR